MRLSTIGIAKPPVVDRVDRALALLMAAPPAAVLVRRRSLVAAVGSVGIAVAVVAGYFAFVARYAVNGVYMDEWNWVGLVHSSYEGRLRLADLWLQHNENRMLFPNVIMLLLGKSTGFSDIVFVYAGAILLLTSVLLLIVTLRRDLVQHPLAYLPAIFLLFSLAKYENTLWAFQFAWFLVVACLIGALLLLLASSLPAWRLGFAIALGIVGSYSSLQGLLVWPAGLLVLMRPGMSARHRVVWLAAGVLVTALYLHGMSDTALGVTPLSEFPARVPTAIEGFFVAIGSVMPDVRPGSDFSVTVVFGVVVALAGAIVVMSWIRHGRQDRVLTIAAALVVVGLLFDVLLMPSRLSGDPINATVSRYTTFNLLLLAGAYIGAARTFLMARGSAGPQRIAPSGTFVGLMLVLVCVQVVTATQAGMLGGVATHASHAEAADLTANHATAPASLVAIFAYPPSYSYFQSQSAFLEANQLNIYADGEDATYQSTGVLAGGTVAASLPVPPEFGDLRSHGSQWRAWLALSSVYAQRPDLQTAFPGPTVQASRSLVSWALQFGMDPADPVYAPVLQPYSAQYRALLADEG